MARERDREREGKMVRERRLYTQEKKDWPFAQNSHRINCCNYVVTLLLIYIIHSHYHTPLLNHLLQPFAFFTF